MRLSYYRRTIRMPLVILLCTMLFGTIACGRKGNIRAPEDTAPGPVKFLTGAGQTDGVLLTWVAPEEVATGASIGSQDLERFVIKRSPFIPGNSPQFEEISEIAVRELKGGEGSVVGGGKPVKGGLQFSYVDSDVQPGQKYEYVVLGVNARGVEGPTDRTVRITFSGESSVVESINPAKAKR